MKTAALLLVLSVPFVPAPAAAAGVPDAPIVLALGTAMEGPSAHDHIGLADHIRTGERTFARLVLGGRVLVLARDSAVLTIIEVPGAATISIERGRVAITVDRENLHPEDLIEVRTPHAVASVPEETLVVEVAADESTFTSLGAKVDVFAVDSATGSVAAMPTPVASNEAVTVARAPATDVAIAPAPDVPRR